jgi:hypothetical protein
LSIQNSFNTEHNGQPSTNVINRVKFMLHLIQMSERSPREVIPVVLTFEVFRRIWFESGGTDIFGDATDEELEASARAVIESEYEDESQTMEDAKAIRSEDYDNLLT